MHKHVMTNKFLQTFNIICRVICDVFYPGSVVTFTLTSTDDLKPFPANCVHQWATIRKKLHISYF